MFRENNRVMERRRAESDDHVFANVHSYDGHLDSDTWIQLPQSYTCYTYRS